MNNKELLTKILNTEPLTDEVFREEGEKEMKREGLYATDLGGIVDVFGLEGLFKIVRYCRDNGLIPKHEAMPDANDGGTVTFKKL
jgi:hypothetical protein